MRAYALFDGVPPNWVFSLHPVSPPVRTTYIIDLHLHLPLVVIDLGL